MIPVNNLSEKIATHRVLIERAVQRVLDSGRFVLGPEVERFETLFAQYLSIRHCIGVGNGTDALELALRALGVGKGAPVATVANAGMYTGTALHAAGATPFFLDVRADNHLVSHEEVLRAIHAGAKAIVLTHLYGLVTPEIRNIAQSCREAEIPLIEDCAQAHGAIEQGKQAGTFGDLATFSFYPTKNLGALGDGGAIVCNSDVLSGKLRSLRQYGWRRKYDSRDTGGRNSRLDEIQAAILCDLLPCLDASNRRRRDIAGRYSTEIHHPAIVTPGTFGSHYVAHLYVIRCENRDSLRQFLADSGIGTEIHYPIPDHRQALWQNSFENIRLPVTEDLVRTILTLPCYPEMSDAAVSTVITAINRWQG